LNCSFEEWVFLAFFSPCFSLVLFFYVLDWLFRGFNCLFSLLSFNYCVVTGLLVNEVDVLFLSLDWKCKLSIKNSQIQCQTSCLHIL
jgi:hypothetical protein